MLGRCEYAYSAKGNLPHEGSSVTRTTKPFSNSSRIQDSFRFEQYAGLPPAQPPLCMRHSQQPVPIFLHPGQRQNPRASASHVTSIFMLSSC